MSNKIIKNNLGFSILEIVAAISIIAIGMVGVLSLVIQNIQAQYINKNVLIASGLAQEGLELVRNVRDVNWLTPNYSWSKDLTLGFDTTKNFIIDYRRDRAYIQEVNGIDDTYPSTTLKINDDGFYWHGDGKDSIFKRMIMVEEKKIDQGKPATYLDLKCTIRWNEGSQNHDYIAETYLYDWR